jgi:O-acetyl-ADP-ribose deacetylase (regulator of RNase III)
MITFKSGDMFIDGRYDVMVNTVNCVGVMGKGVAKEFKLRWPVMFEEYREKCSRGEILPGTLHVWGEDMDVTIVNLPTKRHWRDGSRYEDVESGLIALEEYLKTRGPITVALPPPGCGNGGLDWNVVKKMVSKHLSGVEALVTAFEPVGWNP